MAAKKLNFATCSIKKTVLAFSISAALGVAFTPIAHADALDNLIEKLKEKGIINEQEYKDVIEVREGERAVARKRKQETDEVRTKTEDRAKTEMVGNFSDGIRWESADKKNSIGLNGRMQLDYRNFSGDDAWAADTFDIRRAYLTVAGKFWDYYSFDLSADFAGLTGGTANVTTTTTCSADPCTKGNISSTSSTVNPRQASHLDVAWFNAAWWQGAQFRFGQFKMPMSIEEQTSSRFIDFQERSIVNQFVPAKERGIMLHGTPTTGLFYGVAVSTGQGKNNNENDNTTDGTDYIGRVGVNIAEMVGQKSAVYHLAAAYSTGKVPSGAVPGGTISARTEGRGATFFNTAAFDGANVERTRTGLEGAVAYGPVKVQAEYVKSDYDGTSKAGKDFSRGIDTWYASVNWLITGERYADNYRNGAFGRIRPNANFSPSAAGMGAWELGLRYTNFDASDFKFVPNDGTGTIGNTVTNKANAYTVGLKWLPTPNTRFLLNYIQTKFDTPVTSGGVKADDEKAITFRAQFDF